MKPWEANIRKVVPYTPGEQPNESGMIKLNTNENPYSPAPGVEKALKALDADTLRLYPDPTAGDLVHSIAAFYGLKDEQVFTGLVPMTYWLCVFSHFLIQRNRSCSRTSLILSMMYGQIF